MFGGGVVTKNNNAEYLSISNKKQQREETQIMCSINTDKYTPTLNVWGEGGGVAKTFYFQQKQQQQLNVKLIWVIYFWLLSFVCWMLACVKWFKNEGRTEMFYLMTNLTHFIYGYMASDIW